MENNLIYFFEDSDILDFQKSLIKYEYLRTNFNKLQ